MLEVHMECGQKREIQRYLVTIAGRWIISSVLIVTLQFAAHDTDLINNVGRMALMPLLLLS